MFESVTLPVLAGGLIVAHLAGLLTAISALMSSRTPQGSVAWILSLVFAPWISVPIYWLFGRSRFAGSVSARRGEDSRLMERLAPAIVAIEKHRVELPQSRGGVTASERLARLPTLGGNRVEPLRDGWATFQSIFAGLGRARSTVLVQFYILRDDRLGRELKERLVACARRGIRIHLLIDKVGSLALPESYLQALREEGIEARRFWSSQGRATRFQVNFRNHRKIVVVDGREGWLGGLNVGDEYVGRDEELGRWRDTHVRIEGPAALALQLSFVEDWFWATGDVPELPWDPEPPRGLAEGEGEPVLIVPTGPADRDETASLLMQHAIHAARERVWISSPYFVPDSAVQSALKLAALRGADVRILVPKRGDVRLLDLAGIAFLEGLLAAGVRIFRYRDGILHQKTVVVDDAAAAIGTVNLDNRSLRLNFEITALFFGEASIREVARHFELDFGASEELSVEDVTGLPLRVRVLSRIVYLFAPIL
jgi:cardiolipin synthase A/B